MYQRFSRSGRREKKKPRLPPAAEELQQLGEPAAARRHGDKQCVRQMFSSENTYDPAPDGNTKLKKKSSALEFKLSATKRPNTRTTKGLASECVSKSMESKHTSPSLVAKLMGLDTLPTPKVVDKQLNIGDHFETAPLQNDTAHEVRSFHSEINENQDFKDVFEVMDTANHRTCKHQSTKKDKLNYRKDEAHIDLVRKKFMEAKCLATDEALQQSKEFDDALEILDSNKDLLLEFLQHPNSLFAKHLQDFKLEPPSHPCHITILKSSKGAICGSREVRSSSEINPGKYSDLQKEVMRSSSRKLAMNIAHNPNKDHNGSCLKSSSVRYAGKSGSRIHPTRIVILKPNLEKAQKVSGVVSFEQKNFHLCYRTHPGNQELHKKGREKQKLSESLCHKSKGSSELTKEITTGMRQNIIRRSRRAVSELNANARDMKSSSILSDDSKLEKNESFGQLSDLSGEWSSFLPSPCSSESFVVREARKRLSERWKVARRFQEMGLVSKGSNTLGEMLAQSDGEEPKTIIDLLSTKKDMDEKFARNDKLERKVCPLGISSNDGWKDANYRKLSRSKSLPSSSTASDVGKSSNGKGSGGRGKYYMLKDVLTMGSDDFPHAKFSVKGESPLQSSFYYSNNDQSVHPIREESLQPEQEIHVNSEEFKKITSARCLSDEESLDSISTDESVTGSRHIASSGSFITEREPRIGTTEVEQAKQFAIQVPPQDKEFSALGCKDVVTQGCHSPIPCPSEAAESCVTHSSKEVDQPSLEPSSDEESSTSGCFERISADLQELRMQLRLLKLESGRSNAGEESDADVSSDEYCAGDDRSSVSTEEAIQTFKNEDDRDLSYVHDMLVHSGINGTDKDRLFDCCCSSTDYPVDEGVLNKLEKKYRTIPSWSRSERRLLFDTTNCMLSTLANQSKRRAPAQQHSDDLVGAVWQMVSKQREEVGSNREVMLDSRLSGLEDEIECVRKDIEKVICDDLLEEIVAEFFI